MPTHTEPSLSWQRLDIRLLEKRLAGMNNPVCAAAVTAIKNRYSISVVLFFIVMVSFLLVSELSRMQRYKYLLKRAKKQVFFFFFLFFSATSDAFFPQLCLLSLLFPMFFYLFHGS